MEYEQAETIESQEYVESKDNAVIEPRMRINHLIPPAGTSYFGRQTITFFNNHEIGSGTKYGRFTWKADVYTYATGAQPADPDFSKKGLMYIVLVHTGYVQIYDKFSADVWNSVQYDLKTVTAGLESSLQLPTTESGTPVGDNFNYKINYGQRMQMFKNNGNEAFTFDAAYEEDFTRVAAKQTGQKAPLLQFLVNTTKNSSHHRNTEVYGLSVFTINNPSAFPITLTRSFTFRGSGIGGWSVFGDIRINRGF